MLSHVTIGTDDLQRAKAFYDAVMATLGIGCILHEPEDGLAGYAEGPEATPQVIVLRPIDGRPASVGNGGTVAFVAPDRATVRAFQATALANGSRCEGLRPHYHPDYHGAYARDLDGHKIAGVCHLPAD
jgi:catechol 2,3-dioxygenase-like lactoylglutathione lyase family enzyme